nr:GNAT family N-acetyltransferase [uncultured Steroidobacter sp.]
MTPAEMNNPIWSALTTAQAHFAIGGPIAKRYPAEVAPFMAVAEPTAAAADALADLVAPGEVVNIISLTPRLDQGWELLATADVVQMIWRDDAPIPAEDATGIDLLGDADTPDMLELTALVFPGYFRRRTPEMGEYFAIRQDGKIAAMAGERMKMFGYEEISAVCTHPNFTGRGYAARLINLLVARQLKRGIVPFLHVNASNARARALYVRLGFVDRVTLPLWLLKRT